jgi:hypothetical protein
MTETGLLIWLDPGAPSGWASFSQKTGFFESGELHLLALGELLSRRLETAAGIGWEKFTIRPGSGRYASDTTALEVTGMARWLAYKHNVLVLNEVQPDARSLGERHLKTLGWRKPGLEDANVAAAHLLSHCLLNRLLPAPLLAQITGGLGEESKAS